MQVFKVSVLLDDMRESSVEIKAETPIDAVLLIESMPKVKAVLGLDKVYPVIDNVIYVDFQAKRRVA